MNLMEHWEKELSSVVFHIHKQQQQQQQKITKQHTNYGETEIQISGQTHKITIKTEKMYLKEWKNQRVLNWWDKGKY